MNADSPAGLAAPRPTALVWLWLSALVIVVDQASKAVIVSHLALYERREWLPVLEITRLHNPGAAFSFLSTASGWQKYFFIVLALGVSTGIVVWLSRLGRQATTLVAGGLALILGGALGNVIDRVTRGFVVDFIHFHWFSSWYFPAFNVADSAITVGAALLLLDSFVSSQRSRP